MALKALTDEERIEARRKAIDARTERAELKRALASGAVTLEEVLERADRQEAIGRMRTFDLLIALRGIGEVRAEKIMNDCEISLNRRLRGLGHRQRAALLRHLA
ncbi:MAG: integration host factor, actinobacterial type [Micrococcaceae bacterium]